MGTLKKIKNKNLKLKIYVLHGWTYSTDKWKPFLKELEQLYDVELLKIPGLTQKISKPWTIEDYINWLEKIIKGKNNVLIGHSNGGRLALAFTLKNPNKVSKLVLMDSAGIKDKRIGIKIKRILFKTVSKTGKKITNSPKLRALIYKTANERDYYEAKSEVKETLLNLINVDFEKKLHELQVPTLIIWGANDKTTPVFMGKKMNELIPFSKLELIEGAKHSPQFTHEKIVAQKIEAFLSNGSI